MNSLYADLVPEVSTAAQTAKCWDLLDIDWKTVYAALCMKAEFEQAAVLYFRPGLWTVPVIKGVMPNRIVATLRRRGVVVHTDTDDLDAAVTTNDRDPKNGTYAVRFKKTIEADSESAHLSANDIESRAVKSTTLTERLLLELGYYLTTDDHLDIKNWTLCAGSRYSDGTVPDVCYDPDDRVIYVRSALPDERKYGLRIRAVE